MFFLSTPRQLKQEKISFFFAQKRRVRDKIFTSNFFSVDLYRHLARNMCVLIFLGKSVSLSLTVSASPAMKCFYAFLFMFAYEIVYS